MRLIPGYEVYWRDAGVTQIGVDPKCAVVLSGLSGAEQTLLGDLPRMFDIGWLRARGNELGLGRDQVAHLQQRLADSGVLIDIAPAAELSADERYWYMAARAGVRRQRDRSGGIVEVRAGGRLGVHIGTVLAEAGVGTVLVTDVVRGLGPGAATRPQQGQVLRPHREAPGILRAANPHVRTNMAPGQRPQLVVTVDQHVIDPVPVRHLLHDRVPQLSVLVTELTARIGPFTRPGEGACSTCLELHRSEQDARWAAVATQAALRRAVPVETTLARWTAVTAAQQVLAVLDGREVACESATVESTAWDAVPRREHWQPHPRCECRKIRPAASNPDEPADGPDSSGSTAAA